MQKKTITFVCSGEITEKEKTNFMKFKITMQGAKKMSNRKVWNIYIYKLILCVGVLKKKSKTIIFRRCSYYIVVLDER